MIIAKWKISGLYHADAQAVAMEINEIGNSATPEQILNKARDDTTELHKCFEWDDTVAAEKWRLQTARQIVCQLVVDTEKSREFKQEIRLFHKVESTEGYKPIELIVKNKDEYEKLLLNAKRDLILFKTKYNNLTELETLFDVIDKLI